MSIVDIVCTSSDHGYHSGPVTHQRALVLMLRFGGVVLVSAFGAVLLPTSWMAASHTWLGMGEFPDVPLTGYLARSLAALYGFHGVLLLIVAGDVIRYERIVLYCGVMNIAFGLMILAIDLHVGMPIWWTVSEGPPLVGIGSVVLFLRNRVLGARH